MTRDEVLTQVRRLLSDEEAPYLWRDEELTVYYDLAVKELCRETGLFVKTVIASTTDGECLYDYPSSLLDIISIKVDGDFLTKIPFSYISSRMGTVGQVKWYCLDYRPDKVLLHYTPSEDGNDNIEIVGSAIPEDNEIDTAIPEKYSHYLIDGVIAIAFTKSDTETISPLAEKYKVSWLANIERVKRDLERQYYNHIDRVFVHRGLL